MKTIECAEVMCWSASAVSSGKPTTTPRETMASETRSSRCGRAWRSRTSTAAPSSAAMTARADVRNSGGEAADRHARRRQRAAEDDDAEKPVAPARRPQIACPSRLLERDPIGRRLCGPATIQYNSGKTVLITGVNTACAATVTRSAEGTRTGDVMSAIRERLASRALGPGRPAALDPRLCATMRRFAVDGGRSL